jgi:hypothetical protein
MKLFRTLVLSAVLLTVAASAFAVTPQVVPPQGYTVTPLQRITVPPNSLNACLAMYDNTVNATGFFNPVGANTEVMDDLSMAMDGDLCSFAFAYSKTTAGTTDATVTIYTNNAVDDPPGAAVAGPFVINGLPTGTNGVLFNYVGPPLAIPADVWFAVKFNTASTGLLIYNPPIAGASDDYYYQLPDAAYFYFGGDPVANFYIQLTTDGPTPTEKSTWGQIKTLYR